MRAKRVDKNRQTLVVIGNGMVSWKLCQRLVEHGANNKDLRIVVFGEETRPAYDRVHLTNLFSGAPEEDLILSPVDWYKENRIELYLDDPVDYVYRELSSVVSRSGLEVAYNRLVFATGSMPFVPQPEWLAIPGVFVYRTIDDFYRIEEYCKNAKRAAVIGGGLLGLEAAKALYDLQDPDDGVTDPRDLKWLKTVHVLEHGPGLMHRQIDKLGADTLKAEIEKLGVRVHVQKDVARILEVGVESAELEASEEFDVANVLDALDFGEPAPRPEPSSVPDSSRAYRPASPASRPDSPAADSDRRSADSDKAPLSLRFAKGVAGVAKGVASILNLTDNPSKRDFSKTGAGRKDYPADSWEQGRGTPYRSMPNARGSTPEPEPEPASEDDAEPARLRLEFADGEELKVDMVVVAAGIRPRGELAAACGLLCAPNGGIMVDERLETSDPQIYAVGECATFQGTTYGLVLPGYQMVDVLVTNLLGGDALFQGADQSAKLKAMGITVAALGEYNEKDEYGNNKPLTSALRYTTGGVYRKLVTRNGRLIGAVTVGDWDNLEQIRESLRSPVPTSFWDMRRFRSTGTLWTKQESQKVADWPATALVCGCMQVTRGALSLAIAEGCATVADLGRKTSAGSMCGSCQPLLADLLGVEEGYKPPAVVPKMRGEIVVQDRGDREPLSRRDGPRSYRGEPPNSSRSGPISGRPPSSGSGRGSTSRRAQAVPGSGPGIPSSGRKSVIPPGPVSPVVMRPSVLTPLPPEYQSGPVTPLPPEYLTDQGDSPQAFEQGAEQYSYGAGVERSARSSDSSYPQDDADVPSAPPSVRTPGGRISTPPPSALGRPNRSSAPPSAPRTPMAGRARISTPPPASRSGGHTSAPPSAPRSSGRSAGGGGGPRTPAPAGARISTPPPPPQSRPLLPRISTPPPAQRGAGRSSAPPPALTRPSAPPAMMFVATDAAVDLDDAGPVSQRRPSVGPQSRKVARGEPRASERQRSSPPNAIHLPPEVTRQAAEAEEEEFVTSRNTLEMMANIFMRDGDKGGSSRPPPSGGALGLILPRAAKVPEEMLEHAVEAAPPAEDAHGDPPRETIPDQPRETIPDQPQENEPEQQRLTEPLQRPPVEPEHWRQTEPEQKRPTEPAETLLAELAEEEARARREAEHAEREDEPQGAAPRAEEPPSSEEAAARQDEAESEEEEGDDGEYEDVPSNLLLPPLPGDEEEDEEDEDEDEDEDDDDDDDLDMPDSDQLAARRSWVPPAARRTSYVEGTLIAIGPELSRNSVQKPEGGLGPLFMASILSVVMSGLSFVLPILFDQADSAGSPLLKVGNEKFWKQASGYSLVGLVLISLLLSLRKRWKRFTWSEFPIFRAFHGIVAVLALLMLALHTGLQLGAHMIRFLSIDFLAACLFGAVIGIVTAVSDEWGPLPKLKHRGRWSYVHIAICFPLPVLVVLHVLQVYFY